MIYNPVSGQDTFLLFILFFLLIAAVTEENIHDFLQKTSSLLLNTITLLLSLPDYQRAVTIETLMC